jgi:hypothetical protein
MFLHGDAVAERGTSFYMERGERRKPRLDTQKVTGQQADTPEGKADLPHLSALLACQLVSMLA